MAVRPVSVSATKSSDSVMNTLAWMRRMGFRPVPLHPRSKAAISRDYVSLTYKPPGDEFWKSANYGVGCVTGPAHSGPLDIDLDCPEAVAFAPLFLPPSPAVFGRKSKQRSHYLYRVETASCDKQAFIDPLTNQTIVELRGDNGHQTVMPGSLHEDTGELIEWADAPFPDVPFVSPEVLMRAVRKVALATLIVRHVWAPGYHNEPTKHITGLLFYLEWTLDEIEQLITAVMEYCGDSDKSRLPTVRATFRRGESGKKISGAGVLRKQLNNDPLVDKILDLAGSPTINLLNEYNERYAVVSLRGRFRIADTRVAPGEPPVFFQKDDWLNITSTDYSDQVSEKGIPIPKNRLWLSNPRRRTYLGGADFMPGSEETTDVLNLWTGWPIEPVKGECTAWLTLLRNVICGGDDVLFKWMEHWFANIVREPRDKSLTAPVIIGKEGAGKSLLLGYFGRILGSSYVVATNEEHIHGRFNNHLGSALLLHSEEALYGGDKRHASIIRSLITDESRIFEQKGIDAVQVKNYLRLVLTSNEPHAAPVRPNDRRYTVIDMEDRVASPSLIAAVLTELRSTGPAALFYHLVHMDYDPMLPRTNMKTDSLMVMKSLNMTPLENWWLSVLESGCILPDYLSWATCPEKEEWPEVVSSSALYVYMTVFMRDRSVRTLPSNVAMASQMNKFVGRTLSRVQKSYDNPLIDDAPQMVKQMSARQLSIVNMPSLAECRKAFENHIGQTIEWPADEKPAGQKLQSAHDKF